MDTGREQANVHVKAWDRVLIRAGVAMAALLAVAAVGLRDLEAAAFAVGALVAVGLLRFRTGLLGRLTLGVLGADVAFWMGTGAVSNLAHGEGFWETALPSVLTLAAATTLVAAVAALIARRRSAQPRNGPRIVQGLALAATIAVIAAAAIGISDAEIARPGDVVVDTEDVRFVPDALDADAGEIGLVVENKDLFWHTFTIKELDVNVNVPVGAERRTTFTSKAGTYDFVCAIPGHTQAGMKGTLTVR